MKKCTCNWTFRYRLKAMDSDGRIFTHNDYSANNVLSSTVWKFDISNNISNKHLDNYLALNIFFLTHTSSLWEFEAFIFQSLYFWRSEELCQGSLWHIWSWTGEQICCRESQVQSVRKIAYEKDWPIEPLKVWEPVGKRIYKEK